MTGHLSQLRGELGGLPGGRETRKKREGPKQRKILERCGLGPVTHRDIPRISAGLVSGKLSLSWVIFKKMDSPVR